MFHSRYSQNVIDKRGEGPRKAETNPARGAVGSKWPYPSVSEVPPKQDRITPEQAKAHNANPFNKAVVQMKQGIDRQAAVDKYAQKRAIGTGIGNLKDRKDARTRWPQ